MIQAVHDTLVNGMSQVQIAVNYLVTNIETLVRLPMKHVVYVNNKITAAMNDRYSANTTTMNVNTRKRSISNNMNVILLFLKNVSNKVKKREKS